MTKEQRKEYCKDCKRSYYHDKDCDVNVEDKGYYNMAGDKCYCKVSLNGKHAEKYPWELKELNK